MLTFCIRVKEKSNSHGEFTEDKISRETPGRQPSLTL
jgi:hypothetical protein